MHRALEASVELNKKLASPHICLLTEPCTTFNKVCYVPPGYTCLPSTTLSSRPRAAIFLPRLTPHVFLPQLSNKDCSAALVETTNGRILLASIYLDYNLAVVPDWLEALMEYADRKCYPTLLSFDSNAHSEFYGPETNERGKDFEEFILQNNLTVENKGLSPTFHAFRRRGNIDTHIDVTLSKGMVPLHDWRVHDMEYNGSDHHTITWSLPLSPTLTPNVRPWLKAKWDVFTDYIANYDFHLPTEFDSYKTDRLLRRWYKVIHKALDLACPKRPAKPTPVEMDWYDDSLRRLHNRTKRKYMAHRRSAAAKKRKSFVKAKRAYRAACRRGKKQSWRLFVEKTPNQSNMAILYKIAQRRDRRSINTLRRPDSTLSEPGSDTIKVLTDAHFPAAQQGTVPLTRDKSLRFSKEELDGRYQTWINPDLVRRAMRKFKPNKAAGPDELKPLVFKYLPDNAIDVLTLIYKACIALSHTPPAWRETKVIFLPKPGKDDYDIPKSYRPISLSNFPLKGLERLVVWKMDEDLQGSPIHPSQHGFSKGKSTDSAISSTTNYIEQHLFEGQHCLGLFLDISSAFDSISIDHIKQTLLDHNGDRELVEWYHSYLGTRYLSVELHGDKNHLTTGTGFPQGGVCSARFWLIAFDEAIRIINSGGIVGVGYADDCGALLGGTHSHNMVEKMQTMLEKLVRWGASCGLHFNPQKTVAIMFSRSTRTFHRLVRMEGELIPFSDTVSYLGVTLDRELKWHIHIQNKIKKAKALLMKMAGLTHSYRGPKPKLMKWAYTGIVRPTLSYAAMVWAHKIEDDTVQEELRKVNRMAINTIVKVPRSTPSRGLEVILDITPLHLHVKQEGLSAFLRLHTHTNIQWEGVFTNLTNSVSHLRYWDYISRDAGIQDFHTETDECHVLRPTTNFVLNTHSYADMAGCQNQVDCNVYTDGSKMGDRVGAGVFIVRDNQQIVADKFRLPNTSTVYQAELTAIREAAALLTAMQGLTSVKFFVDSQAALSTFQADFITSKLALQTITLLNQIPALSVELVWTKAHIGTTGNERADALAKEGTKLPHPLAIPSPRTCVKASIRQLISTAWGNEWSRHTEARQTKLYHSNISKQTSAQLIQWSRLKLGRYIRAVTGHNNLLYHLHNMDHTISPLCRFCLQANEEFHHLATDCPPLWWDRHNISATDPEHTTSWTIHQIIDFAYLPHIDAAFIRPLFTIDRPTPHNTTHNATSPTSPTIDNSQDLDDPDPPTSDADMESDVSVMNATTEESSDFHSDDSIDIDVLPDY